MKAAVFMLGLSAILGLCLLTFIVWVIWSLGREIYDEVTGRWKRIENKRIDSNYERNQFHVPYSQKDFK